MKVIVRTQFDAPSAFVWSRVRKSATLEYICHGLARFKPLEDSLPETWREGQTEALRIYMLNLIPAWEHRITFVEISDHKKRLLTHESGGLLKSWNHLISVAQSQDNVMQTDYVDEIDINAGVFTPLVWAFAHFFYRYRQRRWRKLIKLNRRQFQREESP